MGEEAAGLQRLKSARSDGPRVMVRMPPQLPQPIIFLPHRLKIDTLQQTANNLELEFRTALMCREQLTECKRFYCINLLQGNLVRSKTCSEQCCCQRSDSTSVPDWLRRCIRCAATSMKSSNTDSEATACACHI